MTDDDNIFVMPVPKLGDGLPSSMTYEIATLRDQFAMAALTGITSRDGLSSADYMARFAYQIADFMLEERK
jgi:hypothetical protein